jgi:hypothetical protein
VVESVSVERAEADEFMLGTGFVRLNKHNLPSSSTPERNHHIGDIQKIGLKCIRNMRDRKVLAIGSLLSAELDAWPHLAPVGNQTANDDVRFVGRGGDHT